MAVRFRLPVHEVARWPDWELALLDEFLAKEPAADERIEIALAQLCLLVHRANFQGEKDVKDFMPYINAWPNDIQGRYNETDVEVMRAFMR